MVPQYENSPAQALGGAPASPHTVSASRLRKLDSPRSDPRIRRHLETERRRQETAASQREEDERKRAKAREQAQRLALRQSTGDERTRTLAASVPPEARDLLVRIITNILEAPNDEKKRKLRLSNPKLLPIVNSPQSLAMLRNVGFETVSENGEQHLILPLWMLSGPGQRGPLEQAKSALLGSTGPARGVAAAAAATCGSAPGVSTAAGPLPPLGKPAAASSAPATSAAAEPDPLFVCPLSTEVMTDPVITSLGNTYSREAIEAWFAACVADGRTPTDPLSGQELPDTRLIANVAIRGAALGFLEANRRVRPPPAPAAAPPAPAAAPPRAQPPPAARPADPQLRQLCEMGFDEDQAATALANADGELASAIALLCI